MIVLALYLLLLVLGSSRAARGKPRVWLVVVAPLLLVDCALNAFITGGSFRNTLSAQAWYHRQHRWWGWTYRAINALFFLQDNHCKQAADTETRHGSLWAAWFHDFKRG